MKRDVKTIGPIMIALAIYTVAPAMAVAEPPTPFMIGRYVSDADNNPCNRSWVWITNNETA